MWLPLVPACEVPQQVSNTALLITELFSRSVFICLMLLTSCVDISYSVFFLTSSILVYLQKELVPSCSRSVSQLSSGIQPAIQRGDQLGDYQNDLQCERSGALYVDKTTQF